MLKNNMERYIWQRPPMAEDDIDDILEQLILMGIIDTQHVRMTEEVLN